MPDPRAVLAFEGIDAEYATYAIDNSTITYDATKANGAATTMLDKAVTFSTGKTVALAADGDAVIGRLDAVTSDNYARVQVEGFTTLPGGTSATLTPGTVVVGALLSAAKGYIRSAASATAAELVKYGPTIHDATDATAVVVQF
ncbi:MAG TPA: hypothetical protein VIO16_11345 [Dehalococcoidia bacterium]